MYLRPDDSLSVTVKNTVSPHNTGEECPLPGNSMDHLMLFFCIVIFVFYFDGSIMSGFSEE